ncbi:hypothetical protein GCM10009765_54960 [Fodinicola feengrottensis]|uniref:Uncharacterized protein n=1 Tax=Fodinicola feengrottensis TaxID=435914 RepID=A0ABP4U4V9_9ACTN
MQLVATIIVPVGFDNGPRFGPDGGTEPHYYEVTVGSQSAGLPRDAYQVWSTAHVDVQAHARLQFTRRRLIELCEALVGPAAGTVVERMLADGLLAEFEPGSRTALELLRNYNLHPSAQGMGNSAERPEVFRIGRDGNVLLEVVPDVYSFWCGAFTGSSLWEEVLRYEKELPPDAPLNAEELGHVLSAAVPMIVSSRCGFLEPAG